MTRNAEQSAIPKPRLNSNHYATLGVTPSHTDIEIREAYMALAWTFHPDITGEESATFVSINEAYAALKTPDLRACYDQQLLWLQKRCTACEGKGRRRVGISKRFRYCADCGGLGFLPK